MKHDAAFRQFMATLTPEQRDQFLREAISEAQRRKGEAAASAFQTPDGIVRFVRDILHADPAPYQERILRALVEYKRVAVRGPHGLGKTALASWVVLWSMYAFPDDVKIPTTASAWRQLEHYLWPEIRLWARRASLDPLPHIMALGLRLPGKEAFAVASDDPALLEGAHAKTLVYVLDEAKAIPAGTWDAVEGAFSTGNCYALAISTPGDTSGRFYDIHKRRPGLEDWHVEHVTLEEAIAAGRISQEWAEARRKQWGELSPVYQNRVLGEFSENATDCLIPLAWIEAANERWSDSGGRGTGTVSFGVDVARYGDDMTKIARLHGRVLESITSYSQQSTMETAGRVAIAVQDKAAVIGVDVIGVGAGVYDRLKELGYDNAKPVNVSEAATNAHGQPLTDKSGQLEFLNLRAYLWWMLRESLDPENPDALALPPDDGLTGDLTAPVYSVTSNGRIKVESKDEIRKRIGRSTDDADALALALYPVLFQPYIPQMATMKTLGLTPETQKQVRREPDQRQRHRIPAAPDSLRALVQRRRTPR